MAKYKESEWEESSGNVFADLELDQPEEILARSKLLYRVFLSKVVSFQGINAHQRMSFGI